jgi:hypothetical protein
MIATKTKARMPAVHVISPTGIYDLVTAREALGLQQNTLPREIRKRRLRASKRAGRYFVLGSWLIEWLEGGELSRRRENTVELN